MGHGFRVASQRQGLLTRGRIPDLHRLVIRSTRDALPVGTEGDGPDPCRVPSQGQGLLARGCVPHLHRFVLRSLAIRFPSGLKAMLMTLSACPFRVKVSWPVDASHTFTVPTHNPLAIRLPSGLKATLMTAMLCLSGSRSPGQWTRPNLHHASPSTRDPLSVGTERDAGDNPAGPPRVRSPGPWTRPRPSPPVRIHPRSACRRD